MSFEERRRNLRISIERKRGVNPLNTKGHHMEVNTQAPHQDPSKPKQVGKRIKTKVKVSNLGKNLYPDYINKFTGESFIVAGCGESIILMGDRFAILIPFFFSSSPNLEYSSLIDPECLFNL